MEIQILRSLTDEYKPSAQLLAAINTALFLQRPLLLSGDPGTGKTECANFVARQLNLLYPYTFLSKKALRLDTKSGSQSSDLFYSYDAVSHFGDKTNRSKESFISFNSFGMGCRKPPGWSTWLFLPASPVCGTAVRNISWCTRSDWSIL